MHNANRSTQHQAEDYAFHRLLLSFPSEYDKAMFVPRIR